MNHGKWMSFEEELISDGMEHNRLVMAGFDQKERKKEQPKNNVYKRSGGQN